MSDETHLRAGVIMGPFRRGPGGTGAASRVEAEKIARLLSMQISRAMALGWPVPAQIIHLDKNRVDAYLPIDGASAPGSLTTDERCSGVRGCLAALQIPNPV